MKKIVVRVASSLVFACVAPLSVAHQLYLDGSVGIADAEAGYYDADDDFLRLGAGVTLNDHFSVEAGFWDFGSSRDRGYRLSADALYGALRGSVAIDNNLNLYGRVGLLRWDADIGSRSRKGYDLFFGGGLGFQAGPGQLGFEVHFADIDRMDIRTIGVSYSLPIRF